MSLSAAPLVVGNQQISVEEVVVEEVAGALQPPWTLAEVEAGVETLDLEEEGAETGLCPWH